MLASYEARDAIQAFGRKYLFIPSVLIIPLAFISGFLLDIVIPYRIGVLAISVVVLGILVYFVLHRAETIGRESEYVRDSRLLAQIAKMKIWLAIGLGFVFGIVGNLVAEFIQPK